MNPLIQKLFDLSKEIRYVAVYRDGNLEMSERPGLINASAGESDQYEELIVNPTLLKLVTQRGNIDCGGLEHVVIRYGNFFQLVYPLTDGHLSVGFEPHSDPLNSVEKIREIVGKEK